MYLTKLVTNRDIIERSNTQVHSGHYRCIFSSQLLPKVYPRTYCKVYKVTIESSTIIWVSTPYTLSWILKGSPSSLYDPHHQRQSWTQVFFWKLNLFHLWFYNFQLQLSFMFRDKSQHLPGINFRTATASKKPLKSISSLFLIILMPFLYK